MQGATADVVVAVAFALSSVPGLFVLVHELAGTPLVGLALLVPGAAAVAGERLSRSTGGPDIHDRQLDRIVAAFAATSAVALIAVGASEAQVLGSALVLVIPLLAIGFIALLFGTRRLWQQRAVPALLLAVWPVPWMAAQRRVEVWVDPASLTAVLTIAIAVFLVVLGAAPRCVAAWRASRRVPRVTLPPSVSCVPLTRRVAPLPGRVTAPDAETVPMGAVPPGRDAPAAIVDFSLADEDAA
ncbi:hypothetical protein [Actinomycetospora chiangmaiensis]|uniref:hypothetical protein n=1 Tax=Actinomycetospora chiangmaiensis TaxID=402650 RepID=UPI00035E1681|nr:hypothetical protein [Actinomycetospora chiangmaiensis]